MLNPVTFFMKYALEMMEFLLSSQVIREAYIKNNKLFISFNDGKSCKIYNFMYIIYFLESEKGIEMFFNIHNLYDKIIYKVINSKNEPRN